MAALAVVLCVVGGKGYAQNEYQIVQINKGATIAGTVKWSGPEPRPLTFPITKDPQICDPASQKRADLERLVIGPEGGVANTVVYLKNISKGKSMQLSNAKPLLDQKHCRYEPHIILVPRGGELQMKSSDATLHTIHMEGAATYNLPFPFQNQVVSRTFSSPGMVSLKCNGGHVWMNAELFVVPHPYYAVTDVNGNFQMTDVPPGTYEIVAWHEGWKLTHEEKTFDVLTQRSVGRPVFTEARTWEKSVTVNANEMAHVSFVISEK